MSWIVGRLHLLQATETTVEEFRWLSAFPAWVFFLVVAPLAILFAHWVYRRERLSGGPATRWTLTGLRTLVLLFIVVLLAEPVLRTTKFLRQDAVILVLVDDSLSMEIADKYGRRDLAGNLAEFFGSTEDVIEATSRYGLVRRLLRSDDVKLIERLREKGRVVVSTFAGSLQRLREFPRRTGDEPDAPPAHEVEILPDYDSVRASLRVQQTRIADGILDAVSSVSGSRLGSSEQRVAAVVLFTDGQETGGSRAIDDVARRLGQRGVPVYTVGVGDPDDPKDIRMVNLEVNDVVLAGDDVPFDASIVADGYEGERVEVELQFDGRVVDRRTEALGANGEVKSLRFEYRPPEPGEFTVTVAVETRGGELFKDNNAISKTIRVLDQKIKVLYADGLPRWEYRYLESILTRDPTMETQVFLHSADPNFLQESSDGIPPLRRFPETREELFAYHVIVIGDVPVEAGVSDRFLRPEQLQLVRDFVFEAGGGVIFVGGPNSNPLRYRDTSLYSILPVVVPEGARLRWTESQQPITESFNMELTPAGREHTVMRLDNDRERNITLWENPQRRPFENLPGMYWFAKVGAAKKGAVVLAQHPSAAVPGEEDEGIPLLAFMNYGKGRTFYSGVDETWRWRAGEDTRLFGRFWGQVVRFVASGRLLGKTPRFSITTDKVSYTLGETVNIEARVFDANMKPVTDPQVKAYQAAGAAAPTELELDLDAVRGQGVYRGSVLANQLGPHEIWLGTTAEKLAFRSYSVAVPAIELRDPRRNSPLLEELAVSSEGKSYELYEVGELIDSIEGQSRSRRGRYEDDAIWDETWILLSFTGLIALEWILRKMARLL